MVFQPQKGKQGTKGAKQIVDENVATLKFYQYMAAGSTTLFFILNFLFFEFTGTVSVSDLVHEPIINYAVFSNVVVYSCESLNNHFFLIFFSGDGFHVSSNFTCFISIHGIHVKTKIFRNRRTFRQWKRFKYGGWYRRVSISLIDLFQ